MASTLSRGSSVAHYRIVSTLGAGGMGEVYEARDEHLDRSVALKILPPELVQNDDRVRRFVQEAKSASGLNHPHIVTIYDIGHSQPSNPGETEADAAPQAVHYIAMELVRGRTLRDKIHHEQAPLKDLLRWLAQAAEGVAKAHAAGIIHRDLKPENIMISSDGFAKILDFGLAKLTERRTASDGATAAPTAVQQNTREGAVLGTVGYMSPEQVQGKVVDERSDIFSFGCILYEATTRSRPFDAPSDIEVMHGIINAQPAPVGELNPDAPSELRKLIRRCLAKDPEKRYQSMKDLSLELFDLVDDFDQLSISNPSGSSLSGGAASVLVHRRHWALPLAVVVAGVAIGSAIWFTRREAPAHVAAATHLKFAQLTTAGGQEEQPTISPDGQFVAYVARHDGAPDWDIFLLRIGGSKAINLTEGSDQDDWCPSFSPDGQWIAFRSERGGGGIFVMGATGESVRRISDFGHSPSWAPDGKRIVVSTETGNNPRGRTTIASLWVIDVQSGAKKKIYDGDAVGPQWSPDGKRIAFWALPHVSKGQRDILTIPAEGGKATAITDDPALDWSPAWASDSRTLYFASDRGGTMNVWRVGVDPQSGAAVGEPEALTTPSQWSGELSVARNASRLVYAATNGSLNVHRIGFDPATLTAAASDAPVTSGTTLFLDADSSPDSKQVVTRSWSGQEDIYVVGADGSGLRKIIDDPAKDRGPRWTPDGKITFYSDRNGRYEIWIIDPDGSNLRQVTRTTGRSVWFPLVSPDGKRLATTNEAGGRIFDLTKPWPVSDPEVLPPLDSTGATFNITAWSPDGTMLAGIGTRGAEELRGLWVYSFSSKTYRKVTEVGSGYASRPSWLADGRHLITADKGKLMMVDVATGEARELFEPKGYLVQTPTVARDQKSIYFITGRNEGDLWMATIE